jgi:signal peptidase I
LKRSHLAREIIETIALTLIIFFVIRFAVQNYQVEGISMQPTLVNNELVLVNKMAYLFHAPERGDVIVFHWPVNTQKDLIKRVIGLPGDVIVMDSKTVKVNGVVLNEPYISAPANPVANVWKVPPDDYFVMGDNRQYSDDSRDWGYVPKDFIVGKAALIYWPMHDWQFLNTYPQVYDRIKAPH